MLPDGVEPDPLSKGHGAAPDPPLPVVTPTVDALSKSSVTDVGGVDGGEDGGGGGRDGGDGENGGDGGDSGGDGGDGGGGGDGCDHGGGGITRGPQSKQSVPYAHQMPPSSQEPSEAQYGSPPTQVFSHCCDATGVAIPRSSSTVTATRVQRRGDEVPAARFPPRHNVLLAANDSMTTSTDSRRRPTRPRFVSARAAVGASRVDGEPMLPYLEQVSKKERCDWRPISGIGGVGGGGGTKMHGMAASLPAQATPSVVPDASPKSVRGGATPPAKPSRRHRIRTTCAAAGSRPSPQTGRERP